MISLKKGFTLAEVLITLGIIGVVAVVTIPLVLRYYKKLVLETQFKKTYSDLNNLILRSMADNGHYQFWDYTMGYKNFVNTYFAPYMQLELCGWYNAGKKDACFVQLDSSYNTWYMQPDKRTETGGWAGVMPKYIMSDGRFIGIEPVYDAGRDWRYVIFVVDINGRRGSSTLGEDVFQFCLMHYNYGGKLHSRFSAGTCVNGGSSWSSAAETLWECTETGYSCGYYLETNNFKFPDDYPIKF